MWRRRHRTPSIDRRSLAAPILAVLALAGVGLIWSAYGTPSGAQAGPPTVAPVQKSAGLAAAGPPGGAEAAPRAAPPGPAPLSPGLAELINADLPISTAPNAAAAPFDLKTADPASQASALTCLTMAVYYEAASQSDQGEAAVAQVVLNRVRNPLFPKTVCGVVFQGSTLPTGCQFTFACDGSLSRKPSPAGWLRARQIAQTALGGYVERSVGEATHYHTVWVVPYWRNSVVKVAQIGAHVFYRWNGALGAPGAFTRPYQGVESAPAQIQALSVDGVDPAQATPQPVTITAAQAIVSGRAAPAPPIAPQAAVVASLAPPVRLADNASHRAAEDHRLPVPTHW